MVTQSSTGRDSKRGWAWRSALPFVALALTYASLAQGVGWNQNAHYALVRALADGTAVVDAYRDETGDVAWVDGHYYAAKAPGLALATVPLYVALDALGVKEVLARVPGATDETVGMLWALGLVGCVAPAVAIALLVRRLGDEVDGDGLLAAVALGLGTLLLPFATLFFAHVLAAALAFAAFAIVWLWPRWSVVAGICAGAAVVVDYPLGLAAIIIGVYAVTRGRRNALLYVVGAAIGVTPLLAYQWWAFGSPFHVAYESAVLVGGASGHDVVGANEAGFFGVEVPSFTVAIELLFARVGLLRLSPLLAVAAAGLVLLWRRGWRAEAATIGAVSLGYLVYNSGYYQPFGGFVPGPRFLLPIVPFLGVPLALAIRRLPLTSLVLAAISVALFAAVTATGPLLAHDGRWHERLADGYFAGRSWPAVVPFAFLLVLTVALTLRAARIHVTARELPAAVVAVGSWVVIWIVARDQLEGWTVAGALAVCALTAVALVVVARLRPAATLG